jgi:hypothetical protein
VVPTPTTETGLTTKPAEPMTVMSPVRNFIDFEVDERADDESVDGAGPDGGSDGRSVTDYDARVMHTMTEPEPFLCILPPWFSAPPVSPASPLLFLALPAATPSPTH